MLGLLLPASSLFAQYTLTYETNGDEITLTGFTGTPVNVTIPEFVTGIGQEAFYECASLASVTIPGTVTSIGEYSFEFCTGLTNATIGNGVTEIGDEIFADCSGLINVNIPDGVIVEDEAFAGCYSLISLYFEGNAPGADSTAFAPPAGSRLSGPVKVNQTDFKPKGQ